LSRDQVIRHLILLLAKKFNMGSLRLTEQINGLQKTRDQKEKQRNLYEKRRSEHREKIMLLEHSMSDAERVRQEMQQVAKSLEEAEAAIKSHTVRLGVLSPQIADGKRKVNDLAVALSKLSSEYTAEFRALETRHIEVQSMSREIQR
jgi:chromosome segregation ATPase